MADTTATFTNDPTKFDVTERYVIYQGTVAIGAAPLTYPAGGPVLNLAVSGVMQSEAPADVFIWDDPPTGWVYGYDSGTNIKDGKLLVLGQVPSDATAGQLPLVEIAGGTAVPASLSGATIRCRFKVRKGR